MSISADVLIGIDWGGTKIEGIALTREGHELLRLREDTPRHDYEGCLRIIGNLVSRLENKSVGEARSELVSRVRLNLNPGSEKERARPGSWVNPSNATCARCWAARFASRTMPTVWPPQKP